MSISFIERFLGDVNLLLLSGKQSRKRYNRVLALDFRIFDFFRFDELALSRCLGDLLDENGSHGQGDLFISNFISRFNIPSEFKNTYKRVSLEFDIPNVGRVDLLLRGANGCIAIENKPWANDQPGQLYRYACWLSDEAMNNVSKWRLIYLCNDEISDFTLPVHVGEHIRCNVLHITFYQLFDWLRECAKDVLAPSVRFFVEALAQFINEKINCEGNMQDQDEITSLALRSADNIRSIFLIAQSMSNIKAQLWRNFISDLEHNLRAENIEFHSVEHNEELLRGDRYGAFWVTFKPTSRLALFWEFDSGNYQGLYLGVAKIYESVIDEQCCIRIQEEMKAALGVDSKQKDNDSWPWWTWMHDIDASVEKYWGNTPECWEKLILHGDDGFSHSVTEVIKRLRKGNFNFDLLE